jgi:hypothetical protein
MQDGERGYAKPYVTLWNFIGSMMLAILETLYNSCNSETNECCVLPTTWHGYCTFL